MKKYLILNFFGLLIIFNLNAQSAQKPAVVKISGDISHPYELTMADIQGYEQTEVSRKGKDGTSRIYTGVLLATLLQKAGAPLGKELRGKNLKKYLLISASDGYQVVFALAEMDKDFTENQIILALTADGKLLDPKEGPFMIITPDEKIPARCIRQVTEIKVETAD